MVHQIENFFGCYLLYCKNPKYKGRTYIGFTVNPKRRLAQHNAGKHKGGAWRTSGRGPWDMTLIVHGFPSDIAALRFEWAWQHPEASRRLKHVTRKSRKETAYQYRVRILSHMVCERPWSILPLTVRWLKQEYYTELCPAPPSHIPLAFGPVDVKMPTKCQKKKTDIVNTKDPETDHTEYTSLLERMEQKLKDLKDADRMAASATHIKCSLCKESITEGSALKCVEQCSSSFHIHCLAEDFLKDKLHEIIPVEGFCPICKELLLWGDLIRKSKGFYQYMGEDL
ncbi:structure-specific endonuclease subunit slx1-like [Styela clava]